MDELIEGERPPTVTELVAIGTIQRDLVDEPNGSYVANTTCETEAIEVIPDPNGSPAYLLPEVRPQRTQQPFVRAVERRESLKAIPLLD